MLAESLKTDEALLAVEGSPLETLGPEANTAASAAVRRNAELAKRLFPSP
jgi:hypothetical protein